MKRGRCYLCFRYDGAVPSCAPVKPGDERSDDDRTGPDETAEVTAWNVVPLLNRESQPVCSFKPFSRGRGAAHLFHDKRVHHVEHVPRYPHGPVLVEERSPLKAEREGGAAVRQEIKPLRQ